METNTNENFNIEDNKSLGYIKLFRSIENWEWYDDMPTFKLFVHCLLRANHQPREWRGIKIDRGQFVTSYEKLAVDAGLTKKQVRTAIKKLKSTGEVAHEGHTQYSVITVNNYDLYQEKDTPKDTQETNERQSKGNQRATNKNYKNEKNDKNDNKFINDKIVSIKKTDPYINPTKKHFIDKAKEILGFKPYLDASMCNKLIELSAEIDDFQETIPIVLEKIKNKKWKFADGSKDVTVNWLLKDSNYTSVLNGAFDFETREEIVARLEKAELERRRKYADSNSN